MDARAGDAPKPLHDPADRLPSERPGIVDFDRTHFDTHATDVCIIGSGVAGLTLARRLLAAGRTVTLLESGGTDYERAAAELNMGENVGEPYYRLDHARLRFFGGTAAIWGGRLAPLEPVDFERREWVPWSGWPVTYEEMRPYYAEARRVFGLPAEGPGTADLPRGVSLPDFDPGRIDLKLWSFDRQPDRFTFARCADLRSHPRCTIFTHATVTAIETDHDAGRVTALAVRGSKGRSARFTARTYVLAAGGIENARVLLASKAVVPQGLGNGHDLVGRFFMEHPHARGGRVETPYVWRLLKAFGRRHCVQRQLVAVLIGASKALQAREAMLNTSLTIAPRQPAGKSQFWGMRAYNRVKHDLDPTRRARSAWLRTKKLVQAVQPIVDPARPWLLHKLNRIELALLVRAEQAPNPDSRVTLSAERDRLGMPRVALDWRTSELDVHSVERLVAALGSEMERLGLGRVEPAAWLSEPDRRWRTDPLISAHPIGGYHHMGTTRMAEDPKQGVADGHGRVHGIDNLYIAGSSLFPTSGWANPTLTIAALSLRTADAIARRDGVAVAQASSARRETPS
ncbi:FAD-dependent oxidoreductase [Altererythrobacter soli]|uniref:FAD-dependent oxidoreductase n=1 Tax=Croceibacterium soli TaxID=1739690 RepID=A0A6I4USU4_9SPHN|nr:GMC family oxidoreductase [Croceibacterium soli]MXP42000.1 FAD-dependent oxidoreductase [Croceibacterium soli]